MKKTTLIYELNDRGFNLKAWDTDERGDAIIEISFDGDTIREFVFPSYKIYNIGAHFSDIVDSIINGNNDGYEIASSTGFGGHVAIRDIEK